MHHARQMLRVLIVGLLLLPTSSCSAGVQVGRGSEVKEREANAAAERAEPPKGNTERLPEAYPAVVVDLDKPPRPPPDAIPEPKPTKTKSP